VDPHAGFAAVIEVGQIALENLLLALHRAKKVPQSLEASAGVVDADLFLDAPQLVLAATNDGRFEIGLRAWGPLGVTPAGEPRSARTVALRMRVLVAPALTLASKRLTFALDATTVSLEDIELDVLAGGPFPEPAAEFLASDTFKTLVQLGVSGSLASIAPTSIRVGFLGDLVNRSDLVLSTIVLDGTLALALDVTTDDIATAGDASAVTEFRDGNDVAMGINPVVAPLAFKSVRDQFAAKARAQGATLDPFALTVQEGHLHIEGRAAKTGGSVTFSFDATPQLIRYLPSVTIVEETGTEVEPGGVLEELWFEVSNLDVDVDVEWWARLAEVFTLGAAATYIELEAGVGGDNVENEILASSDRRQAAVVQQFTLAGVRSPTFELRIRRYEVHAEGVFSVATLTPHVPDPALLGPTTASIDEAARHRLNYKVRLPFYALTADPQLRVRWTVRRLDRNVVAVEQDRPAATGRTLKLDLSAPDLVTVPEFNVACRVYRTLGATVEELFDGSVGLRIRDSLDRSHPYVRWRHFVTVPNIHVEPDGSHTLLGMAKIERTSDIHRTAVPGRCLFASRYSLAGPDATTFESLDYLDELPFPVTELVRRRRAVCDYCFFGGPTKTAPLI
jgi:hypothetical protein